MKLVKCVKCTLLVSVLSLVYIHLQMQIFDLAYSGKKSERIAKKIGETNEQIHYQIYSLKSAQNIGSKLLTQNDEMQFVNNDAIVQLVAADASVADVSQIQEISKAKKRRSIISLLSLDFQREARAQE